MEENKKTTFEKYVLPILKYVGIIGASLMSIAYIIIAVILVVGFEQNELKGDVTFALVNAGVGLVIMLFLKIQGISFAKNLPENKKVLDEYYNNKTKDKKTRSIKFYWWISSIKDVLIKGIIIIFTTIGIMYIVIEGTHDYMLFALAGVNLLSFFCFGLLSMNQAYEFYNNRHIPYLKEKLEETKKKEKKENGSKNREQNLQKSGRASSRKSKKHSKHI